MIVAGLAGTTTLKGVANERAQLHKRLGFLIDADNFYRKLGVLIRVSDWLFKKLKRILPW